MFIANKNIDLFLEDREVKKLLEGKDLENKAKAISEAYKENIESFGLDSILKNTPSEVGYFFVSFKNGVTIRVFENKSDYIKVVLKVR